MSDKPPAPPAAPPLAPTGLPEPKVGKRSGFRALVGYHAVVWRESYAEIELELGPPHGNSLGITHGGVLMTIIDAAMGHACTYTPVKGNVRACVTISLTTTFLESPRSGVIRAIGRLVSIDNRVATCAAEVRAADGTLLCLAQGSFRYLPGSERPEGIAKEKLRR